MSASMPHCSVMCTALLYVLSSFCLQANIEWIHGSWLRGLERGESDPSGAAVSQ